MTPEEAAAEVTAQAGTEAFVAKGSNAVLGLVVTNTRRFYERHGLAVRANYFVRNL